MSTDYGLKCLDCDEAFIPDQGSESEMYPLLNNRAKIAEFYKAFQTLDGLSIRITSYYWANNWSCSIADFFAWIATHHTHRLTVVDEYGREHDNPKLRNQMGL